MNWRDKVIKSYLKKVKPNWIYSILFILVTLLWVVISGDQYERKDIDIFSLPGWSWFLYSAITFSTVGLVVYKTGFYLSLSRLYKFLGKTKGEYKQVKRNIWKVWVFIAVCFLIVLIWFLNLVVTIGYNILAFFVYLLNPIGIFLLLYVIIRLTKIYVRF